MRRYWQEITCLTVLILACTWFYLRAAVGPTGGADGTYALVSPRIDKTGSACVQQTGGKYGEAALRQTTFAACDQGAGVAPPQTLSTVAILSLYNPAGNNMRFRVQKVSVAYVSGTLSSGPVFHCAIKSTSQTAPSGGTLLVNLCLDIGSGAVGTGVVRTGSTVAAGVVAIRPLCDLAPQLATTAVAVASTVDDVDGEFVVEPGASYQIQSVQAGAGTNPLISVGVTWTEEPIK
jgi:hypothetical protein